MLDKVCIPFSYTYHHLQDFMNPKSTCDMIKFPNDKLSYVKRNYKFVGKLLPRQEDIKAETFEILNRTRSISLQLRTGFGKSKYILYICSKLKYKTLILCHRVDIIKQWKQYIKETCPTATVQTEDDAKERCTVYTNNKQCNNKEYLECMCKKHFKLKYPDKSIDIKAPSKRNMELKDCDFYIFNAQNISKRNPNDFKNIGVLVSDEAHTFCTNEMAKCFYQSRRKRLILILKIQL